MKGNRTLTLFRVCYQIVQQTFVEMVYCNIKRMPFDDRQLGDAEPGGNKLVGILSVLQPLPVVYNESLRLEVSSC